MEIGVFNLIKLLVGVVLAVSYSMYKKRNELMLTAESLPNDSANEFRKQNMFKFYKKAKTFGFFSLLSILFVYLASYVLPNYLSHTNIDNYRIFTEEESMKLNWTRFISKILCTAMLSFLLYNYYFYYAMKSELDYEGVDLKEAWKDFK